MSSPPPSSWERQFAIDGRRRWSEDGRHECLASSQRVDPRATSQWKASSPAAGRNSPPIAHVVVESNAVHDAATMNEVKRMNEELEALRNHRLQSVTKLVTLVESESGERSRLLDKEREEREAEITQLRSQVSELREGMQEAQKALAEMRAERAAESARVASAADLQSEVQELRALLKAQSGPRQQAQLDEAVTGMRKEMEEFTWDCKEAVIGCKAEVSLMRQEMSSVLGSINGHAEQLRHLEDGFINLASLIPTVRRELDSAGAGGLVPTVNPPPMPPTVVAPKSTAPSSLAPLGTSSFEAVFAEAVEAVEALSTGSMSGSGSSSSVGKDAVSRSSRFSVDACSDDMEGSPGGIDSPGWRLTAAGDLAAGDIAAGSRVDVDALGTGRANGYGCKADLRGTAARRGPDRRLLVQSDQELPAIQEGASEDGSIDGSPRPTPMSNPEIVCAAER